MLSVLIGSTVETYTEELKFFENLENKFNCKVKKKNYHTFETKIEDTFVEFLFGYKPKRDSDYLKSFEKWKKRGRRLPPPIEEVSKKIKGDKVLFLSFYGTFKGKLDQVYLPVSVTKKFIKSKENKIKEFNPKKEEKVYFDNILIGKIKGKKSNHITTNFLISPERFIEDREDFMKMVRNLSKNYDSVDMELGVVVENLKGEVRIGAMGTVSDVLNKENLHMEKEVVKNDWDLHLKKCFEAIESLLKNPIS